MAKDKVYVGKAWKKEFEYGALLNVSIQMEKLPKPDQYGQVHIVIGKRREVDPKSKATHNVWIDDYRHKETDAGF